MLPVVDNNMGFTLEGSDSFLRGSQGMEGFPESLLDSDGCLVLHGHDISDEATDDTGYQKKAEFPNVRKAMLVSTGSDPYTLIASSMNIVKQHLLEDLKMDSALVSRKDCKSIGDEHVGSPRGPGIFLDSEVSKLLQNVTIMSFLSCYFFLSDYTCTRTLICGLLWLVHLGFLLHRSFGATSNRRAGVL
jgi:hypothetical protein